MTDHLRHTSHLEPWSLAYQSYEPSEEGQRESLCALGNGYFVTRAALPQSQADQIHYPGTYVAGCYNRSRTVIADRVIEREELVNLPNWLPLTFSIDNEDWFNIDAVEILDYRQELNFLKGVLYRSFRFRDPSRRETVLTQRFFVSMAQPHLASLEVEIIPENWSGRMEIRSALDGRVSNSGAELYRPLNGQHLKSIAAGAHGETGIWLQVRTLQSRVEVALAARTRFYVDGVSANPATAVIQRPLYIAQQASFDAICGSRIRIEKIVSLHTSRDRAISESSLEACKTIERAADIDELERLHVAAWECIWRRCRVELDHEETASAICRLHIFHVLQTISAHSAELDVGVPARGWHGEAYNGHVFWDELFVFPFLNLHFPALSRSLLLYRYRRLEEARWAARRAGYSGAMFPWQSGSNGREETSTVEINPLSGHWLEDHTRIERHINSAIAFNIWHYYQVTGDREFLFSHGAEILLEIARFWSSIAKYNERLQRYEIHGVMGPDEFHDRYPGANDVGISNNTYTNLMAVWGLCRALEVLDVLPSQRRDELCSALTINREELDRWNDISHRMRLMFHKDGAFMQFEGYDQLEPLDLNAYREKYGNIQRLDRILEAEGDTPNRYQVSKQPDALMLFYLLSGEEIAGLCAQLGYYCDQETLHKTLDNYARRSTYGSTLSLVVYAWILARSDRPHSWHSFTRALMSDISDIQGGTTREGIHLGAMAGTVDLIQRCYTGLEFREDSLWLEPSLPDNISALSLTLHYREHWLDLRITKNNVEIVSTEKAPEPIRIHFRGKIHSLEPKARIHFRL